MTQFGYSLPFVWKYRIPGTTHAAAKQRKRAMYEQGTKVRMTKGYRGAEGVITGRSESPFGFYVVELENGIRIVVGSSAFEVICR
jgi:hypothetical protein